MAIFAVVTLIILLLSGLPIAYSLGLAGLLLIYFMLGSDAIFSVPQIMFMSLNTITLSAVPFFILAADILIFAGLTRELVNAVETLLGHVKGGLATVAVVACAFFAAISGSSSATAVAIGSVLIPEMVRRGYNPRYSAGLIAVSGGLGILIPPSIPLIVYGVVAEESVAKLFIAGIIPGIVLALGLIFVGAYLLGKDVKKVEKFSWAERKAAFKKAFWIILLPVIIAWMIYGGIATPTETAGVSVIYALLCGLFLYRGFKIKEIPSIFAESAGTSALILIIIAGASVFAYALAILQIPQKITATVLSANITPVAFLLIVNVILIILGCFIDIISILLLTSPIFLPIVSALEIDPIHFAIIFVVNMELALVTPPLGMHLFILSKLSGLRITEVLKGVIPFVVVEIIVLLLVTYVPQLSLLLVR